MLSRLLHDYYKPVSECLQELDITPTLYAAPWFLTLFASHFPVGFVARVMGEFVVDGVKCGASGGFFFFLLVFFARGMDEFVFGGITRVLFGGLCSFPSGVCRKGHG